MGTLFFALNTSRGAADTVTLAIFDTGFCPDLIKTSKNITIRPVLDVTQSVRYRCSEQNLNNRQFHGHWVLAETLNKLSTKTKIVVIPIVIFNQYGQQKLKYWQKAFKVAKEKKVDLVMAAAGLPIKKEDTGLVTKAGQEVQPNYPLILAAGRTSVGVPKDTLLFPQDFFSKDHLLILGSYHHGLSEKGPHFFDSGLIRPQDIDLFLPYNFKPRLFGNLKGTSLSTAKGMNVFLRDCPQPKDILNCFNKTLKLQDVEVKTKKSKRTIKTLTRALLTKK